MKRKTELLAPAGGMEQFISAVENGANAVYVGGPRFNARINAENFILEELENAVDYGHLRGVRTYVTMNTLLKDEDLGDALEYAKKLYMIGVDALIIQDLGLGLLIHQELPDFELHLSTQATVYNKEGVQAARKLGYKRVVLARELSIDEIKLCCKEPRKNSVGENGNSEKMDAPYDKEANSLSWPEIEVFVHGALCYCYSGQCQLSRYIGMCGISKDGKKNSIRSGNCGSCAQPCRLPYKYVYEDGTKSKNMYPLSPKDLCMIDNLGELIDAGVTSLKIEGRMKSPEYVATVTRIYRKYLDIYLRKGKYKVDEADREDLLQIFNRGEFTEGYSHKDPNEDFMCGVSPKNQGIKIGKVEKYINGKKSLLCQVSLDGPLELHDVVELRDDRGNTTSFKVTYLENKGNHIFAIGDLKEEIGHDAAVYRIVSESLNRRASSEKTFGRKSKVNMTFYAGVDNSMKLSADFIDSINGKIGITRTLENFMVQEAKNAPTDESKIEEQLRKTGDTPFAVEHVRIIIDGNCFIPVSRLNELRRTVLDELEDNVKSSFKRVICENNHAERANEGAAKVVNNFKDEGTIRVRNNNITERVNKEIITPINEMQMMGLGKMLSVSEYLKLLDGENTIVLPQISKGSFDHELVKIAEKIKGKSEVDLLDEIKVVVNNIGELWTFNNTLTRKPFDTGCIIEAQGKGKESDENGNQNINDRVKLVGGHGLNILNSKCVEAYMMLGMSDEYVSSAETFGRDDMEGIPLMITEHEMKPGILIDRRGQEYTVEFNDEEHKTYIFGIK